MNISVRTQKTLLLNIQNRAFAAAPIRKASVIPPKCCPQRSGLPINNATELSSTMSRVGDTPQHIIDRAAAGVYCT